MYINSLNAERYHKTLLQFVYSNKEKESKHKKQNKTILKINESLNLPVDR